MDALQRASGKLAGDYRAATTADEKEKIKTELKANISKLFDMREQKREQEIARFDQHLTELKSRLEKRKANRDQIIEKKLKEMTDGNEIEW
jgi:regulator of sigma D